MDKANCTDWMVPKVDGEMGRQISCHRMSIVEPVFGNLTINKKVRRFSLSGLKFF